MTAQRYIGLNKEVTRGTAPVWTGGGPLWLPVAPTPTTTPNLAWEQDKSLRGSPVDTYNDVPLVRHDEIDFKGYVFADTFPGILMSVLGGPDAVTGSVAPYSHAIPLLNLPESGSQPPSYSIADVDLIEEAGVSFNAKQMTAGQGIELDIDFAATGALTYSTKFAANPYTQFGKPTASFSTEILIPAYNGVINFSNTQSFVVTKGTLSLKRSTAPVFTIGSASPYRLWAGVFNVTGTFEFLALADEINMLNGLTYSKQVTNLTWTEPVSGHSVYFQMSQVQFMKPKVSSDQPYVTVTVDFNAEANTTDAASGYSPLTARVVNAVSAAY